MFVHWLFGNYGSQVFDSDATLTEHYRQITRKSKLTSV